MPPLEEMDLTDKAVVWPITSIDSNGRPIVGEPEEIDCKWEEKRGRTRLSAESSDYEAKIRVADDIPIGSAIWLGELADWTGVRPDEGKDVLEIVAENKTYDLKGRFSHKMMTAIKLRNSWPNTVTEEGGSSMQVDHELSTVQYNKKTAIGNDTDEIVCTVTLRDSNGRPMEGRAVDLGVSENALISYDNSPQDTDDSGEARLVIRMDIPNGDGNQTLTLLPQTSEDGAIGKQTTVTFTEP